MALKKEIIDENGIKTDYHKIDNMYIDTTKEQLVITVKSYNSNEYREKEKKIEKNQKEYMILQEEIDKELSKETKNIEKIKFLADKINSYNFLENKDYSIKKIEIIYEFDDNEISLTKIYDKLKQDPLFVESVDC